jgi:hypothetical protein
MVLARLTVFVVAAIALSGCCALGTGCGVPTAGVMSNWDGIGTGPDDGMMPEQPMTEPQQQPSKKKMARARGGAEGQSEQGMAEDLSTPDADAALARKLVICRDCMPPARDAAAGGAMR